MSYILCAQVRQEVSKFSNHPHSDPSAQGKFITLVPARSKIIIDTQKAWQQFYQLQFGSSF